MKFNNFQFSLRRCSLQAIFNKKNGFTLIESLVVVTMMLVVVALGVTSYSGASKKNRDNKRMADMERIRMALEMYRQNSTDGTYPANGDDLIPDYMDSWPTGPKGETDAYTYNQTGTGFTYELITTLEVSGAEYRLTNP